jgi:hypothetical protein
VLFVRSPAVPETVNRATCIILAATSRPPIMHGPSVGGVDVSFTPSREVVPTYDFRHPQRAASCLIAFA